MASDKRDMGERLVHGVTGGVLAGLAAVVVHFWVWPVAVNGWGIAGAAFGGFALAWLFGEEVIEFLKAFLNGVWR